MTIWDDLYKDLVKSELKQDGSPSVDAQFKTVEAKVEELRQRVGLDAVKHMTKEASLKKSASEEKDSKKDKKISDIKAYIAGLLDIRRASISVVALLDDIKDKFSEDLDLIREMKGELEEFATKHLEKWKINPPAPVPTILKPEGNQEGKDQIFENIADKLKH